MKEVITEKEKARSLKKLLESFKEKTASRIKKILSWEKPEGRNEFYKEYKYRFAQLTLEEQLGIYYTLENHLNKLGNGSVPYEELTERIKPFLEEDESEGAQRVLDLIINEDIFKEDGLEFLDAMSKSIVKAKEHHTEEEIKIINKRVLQTIKK